MSSANEQSDSAAIPQAPALGRFGGLLLIGAQLALVAAIVRLFRVEQQRHLFPLLCLLTGGFVVHSLLPARMRMPFFAALSMGALLFVLGLENGLWVLGLGGTLIGICRLPTGIWVRVALLAVCAIVLMAFRNRHPAPFWPVLGSMFMFRLILYVFEVRKQKQPEPLATTAAYFFMAPNVSFPLFPVVDYRTFRSTWQPESSIAVAQRGVSWMIRGIVHLLLYRYVKTCLVPQPHELYDLPHVVLFMATNYALYLQVSGQFHLITGILHLFGFDLPRTHNQFFLASSFSDIWRRINIYWKDFMTKCFFYPALYGLRSRGASLNVALVASVFVVFVATWLLHSWQTFWLLGRFPVTMNDAVLWLGAGSCVAVNALLETRRKPQHEPAAWLSAVRQAVQTVGMFGLVSLFWAFWTRPGFSSVLLGVLQRPGAGHGAATVALWAGGAAIAALIARQLTNRRTAHAANVPQRLSQRDVALLHVVGLGMVAAVALPGFSKLLTPRLAASITEFRTDAAAARAAADRLQGYYEDLNMAAIQAGPLLASFAPEDESRREQALGYAKVSRKADVMQSVELKPGISVELEGGRFSVNEFGMRDRDSLSLFKSPGTTRIAVIGSSIVMGSGVDDTEVFSRLFEEGLNAERGAQGRRFEVLNFGVGSQWPTHRLVRFQRMVLRFEPDVLLYIAHQDEFSQLDRHPAKILAAGLELPSPQMTDVAQTAGVTADMAPGAIEGRLAQHREEMLDAVYRTFVEECRSHGIRPVYVYLPIPGSTEEDPGETFRALARSAGFEIADLTGWADSVATVTLFNSRDEEHPNASGHRLMAAALLKLVQARPELVEAPAVR